MVLARVAEWISSSRSSASASPSSDELFPQHNARSSDAPLTPSSQDSVDITEMDQVEESHPPFFRAALAGGIGGLCGDMLMHSLDTVKTRQQGDPHLPPKYTRLLPSYLTILRQEGVPRGLYGGVTPAAIGSFGGTSIFFGTYEWSKRVMLREWDFNPTVAYLTAGFVADLAASPLYVPTEVLKTRLQLQGRYNNPFFNSGYNYQSTYNALRTVIRQEGWQALFYGYRATLYRDLPFSALQFAFYEQERKLAKRYAGSNSLSLPVEILVGATAGGAAGIITCPLDVVKTRIQTQITPGARSPRSKPLSSSSSLRAAQTPRSPTKSSPMAGSASRPPTRNISTSSPSTAMRHPGQVTLDTSSVMTGLRLIWQTEGLWGLFRGVGPRGVWTSVQSGCMLVLYQVLLGRLEEWPAVHD